MGSLYIFTIAHHSLPGVVIKTDGAPFLLAMLMLEEGDPDSTDLAMAMLHEAAGRGMAAAQSYLGQWLLAHGGDRAEAIDWLRKAAYLENESAQSILDSLEE